MEGTAARVPGRRLEPLYATSVRSRAPPETARSAARSAAGAGRHNNTKAFLVDNGNIL